VRRLVLLAVAGSALFLGCNAGSNVPGFCGVTDDARVAVGNADPSQYPAVAAQHVAAVRSSAKELSGKQGALAKKVADAFEAASKTKAKSIEFSDAYNRFVHLSNTFDHRFCNQPVDVE
jgi:hypothetical protein